MTPLETSLNGNILQIVIIFIYVSLQYMLSYWSRIPEMLFWSLLQHYINGIIMQFKDNVTIPFLYTRIYSIQYMRMTLPTFLTQLWSIKTKVIQFCIN